MEIRFKRPDGKDARGYLAMPKAGESAPGVVVVPEHWGVDEHIKEVADRLAGDGYRALVADVFHGKVTKDAKEAGQMAAALNGQDAVDQDIRAAVVHLEERSPGSRAAVVGFCIGGGLALAAAVRVRELNAAVDFYGIPPAELADPRQIRIPFLGHFARKDRWITPEKVGVLEKQLEVGGVNHETHRYDADHAFFNDKRQEAYDAKAAQLAWDRTIAFLRRTIGGAGA
ncbi:dienelactone hydrolase family protein [Vulgatibacter incomptus]|uniref:Dienelactone hydrolase family n=1 Tax=Vulgatibacter incomptus TaxID=1391653 RepID=A0A0K1PG36_9BACT|nr:dienelactone hydrolase family protein [Vulgatibacter incomptus]AKU92480.1 Dienelactone hydrolase family [Vulgatibacter incomptus]